MSNQSNIELIDEDEIRTALRPWRPNVDAFARGVRELIAEKSADPNKIDLNRRSSTEDGLALSESRDLQIAASVTPIQLLLGGTGLSSTKASFATLSVVNKIFAVLAMPFACFLMIGVTLVGMLRIHFAQKNQQKPTEDLNKLDVATKAWWRRYGWIAGLIYAATLFAPFYGRMTPLLILLFGSGVAAVSMVVHLAKENLASRRAIGGFCAAAMGILGSASGSFARIGEHWLDQHLVSAVLFGGALLIGALIGPPHFKRIVTAGDSRMWLALSAIIVCLSVGLAYYIGSIFPLVAVAVWAITMAIFLWMHKARRTTHLIFWIAVLSFIFAGVGFHTQTLWRPLSTADVRSYVESFQARRSASWNTLQGPAVWLKENGIQYDQARLRESFERDLKDADLLRVFMLTTGVRTGLLDPQNLIDTEDVIEQRKSLFGRFSKDRYISSLGQYYFAIAAIAADPVFSDSDRDILASRLMATWDKICSKNNRYFQLDEALMVAELLERIDRPAATDRMTKDVHHWLVGMQMPEPKRFQLTGGFGAYPMSIGCDRMSTIPALQLMDRFGAPAGFDWGALRSYLRPSSSDHALINQAILTKVARERLNALNDAPQPTIKDYLIREVPLALALMLVVLAFYATLSAPLPVAEKESKQ